MEKALKLTERVKKILKIGKRLEKALKERPQTIGELICSYDKTILPEDACHALFKRYSSYLIKHPEICSQENLIGKYTRGIHLVQ